MQQRVDVPSDQLLRAFVAQRSDAGGIDECAVACTIDTVDGLAGRLQQELHLLLAVSYSEIRAAQTLR